ncbi:sulfotransferase family protein [Alteromonas sp. ASW11-130]|uniref:sulfotransferase family protein n=1 Tax=Alteromonas sp. ASW11-130 TaxID=3015775 RepID=UPI0022422AF7|nr:sulfotransferase family protein [Alteromonas sp. ASW11-130]MCW8091298.1 hypothetical protein [Alteromonas sp. ASW11-130]
MRKKTKVFCVGFHKTGTSSFTVAMRKLGYAVTGPDGVTDENIAENALSMALQKAHNYDAFQDNPWPIFYRELDAAFPNSKFILTERKPTAWINSQLTHFGDKCTPMRRWIYGEGCPLGHEDIYLKRYTQHIYEVKEYFKSRPRDFLTMNFAEGDGWEKLCTFLNEPIPDELFPNVNKASERKIFSPSNLKRYAKGIFNRFEFNKSN